MCIYQRAKEGHAVDRVADAQAARLQEDEEEGRARSKGQLSLRFPKFITELPQFWQPRFYDFNVYSHKKKNEKLEYMHANPVVRGVVEHPKDWPWSSFSFYAKEEAGLAEIDYINL